jgi:hypothetical protein
LEGDSGADQAGEPAERPEQEEPELDVTYVLVQDVDTEEDEVCLMISDLRGDQRTSLHPLSVRAWNVEKTIEEIMKA